MESKKKAIFGVVKFPGATKFLKGGPVFQHRMLQTEIRVPFLESQL